MNPYEVLSAENRTGVVGLTQDEFREVFCAGELERGIKLQWIQPKGDPSKRVTFAENIQPEAPGGQA